MKKYLLLISLSLSLYATAQSNNNKSFIVNDSQISYTYKAVFDSNKKEEIVQRISSQFNQPKISEGDLVWNLNGSYEIVVYDNNITINFGKSVDNQALFEKIKLLGQDLSAIVNTPSFKHRLVTNKFYVINDKASSYSYRGVFTLNKRANIKKDVEKYFGQPKLFGEHFVWSTSEYDVTLKKDQIEFFLMKRTENNSYYNQMIDLEKDVTEIIVNPGPKNTLITTKNYALNDNPLSYTYKAVFQLRQNKMLKNLISTQFGNPNVSDGDLVWNLSNSYEIVLSDYQLKINFGKSNDNELVYQQIKDLGATITKSLNF